MSKSISNVSDEISPRFSRVCALERELLLSFTLSLSAFLGSEKPTGLFGFIWVVPISSELSFFALFGAPPLLPLLRFLSTMPWYLFSSISN
nr:MAG TPA: hypothetical protein [Caudoviricetes sp.]